MKKQLMSNPKLRARMRRRMKTRSLIRKLRAPRLCVHRTGQHVFAQIILPKEATGETSDKVVASASTVEKDVRAKLKSTGNKEAAKHIGKLIAERALKLGIKQVAFDRSGFQYHGRIAAIAEGAREGELEF